MATLDAPSKKVEQVKGVDNATPGSDVLTQPGSTAAVAAMNNPDAGRATMAQFDGTNNFTISDGKSDSSKKGGDGTTPSTSGTDTPSAKTDGKLTAPPPTSKDNPAAPAAGNDGKLTAPPPTSKDNPAAPAAGNDGKTTGTPPAANDGTQTQPAGDTGAGGAAGAAGQVGDLQKTHHHHPGHVDANPTPTDAAGPGAHHGHGRHHGSDAAPGADQPAGTPPSADKTQLSGTKPGDLALPGNTEPAITPGTNLSLQRPFAPSAQSLDEAAARARIDASEAKIKALLAIPVPSIIARERR